MYLVTKDRTSFWESYPSNQFLCPETKEELDAELSKHSEEVNGKIEKLEQRLEKKKKQLGERLLKNEDLIRMSFEKSWKLKIKSLTSSIQDKPDAQLKFQQFDENDDGNLCFDEFTELSSQLITHILSAEEAEAAYAFFDSDGNGIIKEEDFSAVYERLTKM